MNLSSNWAIDFTEGEELTNDGALFNSAHAALVFAFNSPGSQSRSLMMMMASPAVGGGKGLIGLDAAAQAGMIRAEVQALGSPAEAILIARIAPRWQPCSCRSACCSGRRGNTEWTNAISVLADRVRTTALAGCVSNSILRREYVVRYFTPRDGRGTMDAIAGRNDVNRKTVEAHVGRVAKTLKELESAAQNAIEDRLMAAGIVA